MSDLEKILMVIYDDENYDDDIVLSKIDGITISFDKNGNVKCWGVY